MVAISNLNYADYLSGIQSPFQSAIQGYETGVAIKAQKEKAALAKVQKEEQDLKNAQLIEMKGELATLAQNPNPTAEDYQAIIIKYPDLQDHFQSTIDKLDEEEKYNRQQQALGVFTALSAGQPDLAKNLLEDQIEAAQNSNNQEEVQKGKVLLSILENNPEAAQTSAGMFLASTMGSDKFASTFDTIQENVGALADANLQKKLADIGLTRAQTVETLAKAGAGPDLTSEEKNWKAYLSIKDQYGKSDPELVKQAATVFGVTPETSATDMAAQVEDAEKVFLSENPNATEAEIAKMKVQVRKDFKRAQADEVAANKWAEANVEMQTAQDIAYNTRLGTELALIATAKEKIHAEGKLTEEETRANAKARMHNNLAKMAQAYIDLDSLNGVVNTEDGAAENIWARMKSTGIGQGLQNVLGTNEQSLREYIKSIQPLTIQDIRQASEMSARGLDSERELDFYLKAATDLKSNIQSNLAAIVALDEAYGDGTIAAKLKDKVDPTLLTRIQTEGKTILNGSQMSEEEKQAVIAERQAQGLPTPASGSQPSYLRFAGGQ